MKKLLIIMSLALCSNIYALTCPNNGNILDSNYKLEQVTQLCGQPSSTTSYQKISTAGENWTYYKDAFGTRIKINMTFNDGRLTAINILDAESDANLNCQTSSQFGHAVKEPCAPRTQQLAASNICGLMIQAGNTAEHVRSACGNPSEQKTLSINTAQVQELKYNGVGPSVLAFENGKLVDWKYA